MDQLLVFAYLDPDPGGTPVWQTVLYIALGVAVLLAVVYGLTRFIAWAARR